MITKKNKSFFTLAALGFLILHFTATFFYVAPPSWTGQRLKIYSGYYMLPLFHQSWSLFAPSPPMINKKMMVMIEKKDGTKELVDVFDDFKWWHKRVRVGASGRFIMLLGNTMHSVYATWDYLEKNVPEINQRLSQFRSSTTGLAFEQLISQWILYKFPNWHEEYKSEVSVFIQFEDYSNYLKNRAPQPDQIMLRYQIK